MHPIPAHGPGARAGDRGASLVEYALLVALIAIVCVVAIVFLGGSTSESIEEDTSSLYVP